MGAAEPLTKKISLVKIPNMKAYYYIYYYFTSHVILYHLHLLI